MKHSHLLSMLTTVRILFITIVRLYRYLYIIIRIIIRGIIIRRRTTMRRTTSRRTITDIADTPEAIITVNTDT